MMRAALPRRRSAIRLLWAVIGLFVAAVAGGIVFLKLLDANAYKAALEQQLSAVFNRRVSVGSMSLEWALRPTLGVKDLRIANPPWASREDLLVVREGEVRIELAAFLRGRLAMRALQLRGADLLLERNPQGQGNWIFRPANSGAPVRLPDFGVVTLADARIAWRQLDGTTLEVQVEAAQASIVEGQPFELKAAGTYAGTPMRLAVSAPTALQAALNRQPWRPTARLELQDGELALDMRIPAADSPERLEIDVVAMGRNLQAWSAIAGRPLPAWGPYRFTARSRVLQDGFEVDGLQLSLDGLPTHSPRLDIESGQLRVGHANDIQVTAAGRLGEAALALELSTAPGPEDGAAPLKLNVSLADLVLTAQGRVGAAGASDNLVLQVRGDAAGALHAISGMPGGPALAVDVSAQLSRLQDGYAASDIQGQLLGVSLHGDLAYQGAPRRLAGALSIGPLNLDDPALRAAMPADTTKPASAAGKRSERPALPKDIELDLSLRIASIVGAALPIEDLAGRLQWQGDALKLQQLRGTVAGVRASGDATLRWQGGRAMLDGNASIATLDLARLGTGTAGRARQDPWDRPLPPLSWPALDADLRIGVGRVVGAPMAIDRVSGSATLANGSLRVDLASATVAGIAVRGRVDVSTAGNAWRFEANAQAPRIDWASLTRAPKQAPPISGTMLDTRATLAARGTTARELLAHAGLTLRTAPFTLTMADERDVLAVEQASVDAEPGQPVRLRATGKASGTPVELSITGGRLADLARPATAWPRIEARLRSTLKGQAVQVDASTGPLQRLVSGRDVPLKLLAVAPGVRATLDGTARSLSALARTPWLARVEIDDLSRTAQLFDVASLPAVGAEATGRLTLGDGEVTMAGLAAKVGRSDAQGRLQFRWRGRPKLVADLASSLIDTTQWEQQERAESIALLDHPIPVTELQKADVQLRLRAQRLLLHGYDLAQLKLDGTLDKGLLQLEAHAAEGNLRGNIRFDARKVPGMAMRIELDEVQARTLYTGEVNSGGTSSPRLTMRAQVAGTGPTLGRMLASANGGFIVTAGPGTLPVQAGFGVERMAGNILFVLVPGRRASELNELECAAANFTIANGVATSNDGIVLRFRRMDIMGGGAANLSNGQIRFGYRVVRRNFFSLSLLGLTSGFAQVTGTIGNPTVQLDPRRSLITGTAAWATAGLSLLVSDLWRKLGATGDTCARIAGSARLTDEPLEKMLGEPPH